ncbi:MAG: hypothetical protein LBS57_08065 [Treponema sp.]|jgi:hypothetical protein|nr:hypothetical protein [Treponema sp.]
MRVKELIKNGYILDDGTVLSITRDPFPSNGWVEERHTVTADDMDVSFYHQPCESAEGKEYIVVYRFEQEYGVESIDEEDFPWGDMSCIINVVSEEEWS